MAGAGDLLGHPGAPLMRLLRDLASDGARMPVGVSDGMSCSSGNRQKQGQLFADPPSPLHSIRGFVAREPPPVHEILC